MTRRSIRSWAGTRWTGPGERRPEFRGDEADGYQVAAEVPVPAGAPVYDQLAGFNGRVPE